MRRFLAFILALAAGAVAADDKNTYTFVEPSGGTVHIYWDGKNASGKVLTGFGWTGGDPNDSWYPQPKSGADLVFDDTQRAYRASGYDVHVYTYGYTDYGLKYPLTFNSISQIVGATENPGWVYLWGRSTENYRDTVSVGAGGMSFYFPLTFANDYDLKLAVSQPFYVTKTNYTLHAYVDFGSSLVAPETTTWTMGGKFRLRFVAGQSTNFLGSVVANNAFLFWDTTQHQRVFGKKFTLTSDAINGLDGWPQLLWNFSKTDAKTVITTPIELQLKRNTWYCSSTSGRTVTGSGHAIPWIAMASRDAETDAELRFEAPITGVVSNRCLLLGQSTAQSYETVTSQALSGLGRSDQQRMVFAADNSGLKALGDRNAKVSGEYYYEGWRTLNYTDPGHMIFVNTIVSLAHPNALGTDNGEFNVEFRYGGDINYGGLHIGDQNEYNSTHGYYHLDSQWWNTMFYGTDGSKMKPIMGVVASNGVDVGSSFYMESNMHSGGSDLYGHGCTILLGSDGPGESVFSGTIAHSVWGGSTYRNSPELRFQGGEGGSAVFTHALGFGMAMVTIGKGDVVFTNPDNTFDAGNGNLGSAREPFGMRVRSGRFLITHKNAIRHTGTALQQEVLLGDWVPAAYEVRAYNARIWTKAEVGGSDPKYYSDYTNGLTNNLLEFVTMPQVDGVTLEPGDLVIQSTMGPSLETYTQGSTTTTDPSVLEGWVKDKAPGCAWINGVWQVVDSTHWRRVEWLDEDDEVVAGYGIRLHVTDGKKHAGKTFYLANHEDWTYEKWNNSARKDCGFHFGPVWLSTWSQWRAWACPFLAFHDEPSCNPNASFLLKGSFDYSGKVVVTDNKSSGDSEIGGAAANVTNLFTGVVLVEKPAVCLAASTNSLAMFTTLSNAVGVATTIVKTGAGTVALTNDTLNLTMDGGLTLRAGTLVVTTNFFANKGVETGRPLVYELVNGSSGTLEVAAGTNEVDLAGRTIDLKNFENQKEDTEIVLLKTGGGPLVGEPTVTGLGETTYWRIHVKNNDKKNEHALIASYVKGGTFIIVR